MLKFIPFISFYFMLFTLEKDLIAEITPLGVCQ